MQKRKLTVTVGISVYNEQANIENIIHDVFLQDTTTYELEKVLIVSDGSTDNTNAIINGIKNKKIELIADNKRVGKPERLNQIFKIATSDIVIILDADIKLQSNKIFENLIGPFRANSNIQLTSGVGFSYEAKNFIQKVALIGVTIWYECRTQKNVSELYWCDGSLRAFGKKLYKQMLFPKASADEAFSYLDCITRGYAFQSIKTAVYKNILPSSLSDYINQTKRFLKSPSIQKNNFDENIIKKNYNITIRIKSTNFLKYLLKSPLKTTTYLLISVISRISNMIDQKDSATWEIITSTKNVSRI